MSDPLDGPVQGLMARVLSALSPDTSIAAARKLLIEQHLSGAPVVDTQGHLLGIVSQNDLQNQPGGPPGIARYYVLLEGQTLTETAIPGAELTGGRVGDVMTRQVLTTTATTSLRDAVRIMVTREVHRLLVVDGEKLVGLLSTMDILRALVPDRPAQPDQGF